MRLRRSRTALGLSALLGVAGCGLAANGDLAGASDGGMDVSPMQGADAAHPRDGSTKDSATHDARGDSAKHDGGKRDAVADSPVTHDAAPDSPVTHDAKAADAGCDANACPTLPSNAWSVVAFVSGTAASPPSCPTGFTAEDVLENPTLGASACACGTSYTATSDCDSVTLPTTYSIAGSTATGCSSPGENLVVTAGVCSQLAVAVASAGVSAAPPGTAACSAPDPTPNPAGVVAQRDRLCALAAASCAAPACDPATITGFQTCIMAAGDQACPSGGTKHLVGALDLDCGTCPCTATVDCQGALDLYTGGTNTGCTGTAFSVATGTCKSVPAGTTFGSYEWAPSATQSPVGTVGDATGVSVSLATSSEATVCCQ